MFYYKTEYFGLEAFTPAAYEINYNEKSGDVIYKVQCILMYYVRIMMCAKSYQLIKRYNVVSLSVE